MGPDLSASVAGPPTEVGELWLTVGTKTLAAVVQLEWAAVASSRGCFLIQGSNLSILRLLHCRLILCPWSCLGRPNMCTAAAKSLQSCPTLCDPIDCGPPGFSVLGIFQTRMLEWVTISSSRGSSPPRDQTRVSCVSCISRRVLYH